MKVLLCGLLTLSVSVTFANDFVIKKENLELKVAEIEAQVNCKEISSLDSSSNVDYDCRIGTLKKNISKKFGNVVKVEGLDNVSRHVLVNMVDDAKSYSVNLRVLYY